MCAWVAAAGAGRGVDVGVGGVARIRFLSPSEGGRSTPAVSGVRPHLKLNEILTSCVVRSTGAGEVFELGVEYDVTIEIVFWNEYGGHFHNDSQRFYSWRVLPRALGISSASIQRVSCRSWTPRSLAAWP